MDNLLNAIAENDVGTAQKLLRTDPGLATALIRTARLYETGIFHWIYVGDTPLHLAAAGYRTKIVELLLATGADPNAAMNRRKSTPLHYAADGFITGPAWDAKRQVETIRFLLDRGGDLHARDANGATPLHRAVRTRCVAAAKLLLRGGSDPVARNKAGSTVFHLAVQNTGRGGSGAAAAVEAQREMIAAFLSLGIGIDLRDGKGKSVVDCARSEWIRAMLAGSPD